MDGLVPENPVAISLKGLPFCSENGAKVPTNHPWSLRTLSIKIANFDACNVLTCRGENV